MSEFILRLHDYFKFLHCLPQYDNFDICIAYIHILGGVTHDSLGICSGKLDAWVKSNRYSKPIEIPPSKPKLIKNPEIPVLKEYYIHDDNISNIIILAALHFANFKFFSRTTFSTMMLIVIFILLQ